MVAMCWDLLGIKRHEISEDLGRRVVTAPPVRNICIDTYYLVSQCFHVFAIAGTKLCSTYIQELCSHHDTKLQ